MKANYEDKIPQSASEISFGNLYDVNKQLMEKEPSIDPEVLWQKGQQLEAWLESAFAQKYFMLLCHEQKDYTVFNLDKTNTWARPDRLRCRCAREDVIECLTNRGTLLAMSLQPDNVWEFWIKNPEGCFVYYLFPYGEAVIEY